MAARRRRRGEGGGGGGECTHCWRRESAGAPTERRQQAESLAQRVSVDHSLAVSFSPSRRPDLAFSLSSSPLPHLSLPLSFVVSYSRFAHPPPTARPYARVCACVRCRGRSGIASLWDSLTTAGVFPRDGGRLPALISGRFDLRIFLPFAALSLLARLLLSPLSFSVLSARFCILPLPRCNVPVLLKECSRYARTMGITRGRTDEN